MTDEISSRQSRDGNPSLSAYKTMYYVYVLYSPSFLRTYVGQTNDESNRLHRHNAGFVKSTKPYRPWTLIHSEEFPARSLAIKREKWLKSPTGRRWLKAFIDEWKDRNGLSVSSSHSDDGRDRATLNSVAD